MRIEFIGTGGAFDYRLGNSSAFVTLGEQRILIDCGHTVYSALRDRNKAGSLDAVLLTHFHDDHVGSLSSLILHQKHLSETKQPLTILYPDEDFRDLLLGYLSYSLGHPQEYANFQPVASVPGITPIETTGLHMEWMKSFAYVFQQGDDVFAYSGDLGDPNVVFDWLRKHEKEGATVFHEVTFAEGLYQHAHYKDLEKHLKEFPVYGYHCDPANRPADCRLPLVNEVGRTFEW